MEQGGDTHDTVIEVRDLRKVYGHHVAAVDGISFDVRRGEIFGLLGSNGAGKTTTVECIQGLRALTSGSVRVLGHDPRDRLPRTCAAGSAASFRSPACRTT